MDLAILVQQQGEMIDNIENNIKTAKTYVEKGEKNILQAEEYQRSARKKKCCILLIIIGILIAILTPVLATQLKSS